ncbi:MAG: hypothetical protein LUE89_02785 [Clostridiales bacterium]|nr:hypothetical protein [Clostridiales bacterium]
MSWKEYRRLLKAASDCVPCGVYAVEKGDYAELRNDPCSSRTRLKQRRREWKAQGFKVYANGL